jgi:hypothetical protein
MSSFARRLLLGGTAAGAAAGAAAYATIQLGMPDAPLTHEPWANTSSTAPSRKEQLASLRAGKEFDVLIIGGASCSSCRGARAALLRRCTFLLTRASSSLATLTYPSSFSLPLSPRPMVHNKQGARLAWAQRWTPRREACTWRSLRLKTSARVRDPLGVLRVQWEANATHDSIRRLFFFPIFLGFARTRPFFSSALIKTPL